MVFYSFEDYKLKRFEKSDTLNKKYNAILINTKTKKEIRVPFGDSRYGQFKDSTGLGLFSKNDTLDKKRRDLYRNRHKKDLRDGFYSAGYLAWHYLW
jgi:hypothetical protein